MYRLMTIIAGALTMLVAGLTPLAAQERGRSQEQEVPRGFEPPRGMCRIWIAGVPPGQQPAPTDCATAIRRRPSNGRVIFGPSTREEPGKGAPPVKELTPPRSKPTPPPREPAVRRETPPPEASSRGGERSREKGAPSEGRERRRGPPDSQ